MGNGCLMGRVGGGGQPATASVGGDDGATFEGCKTADFDPPAPTPQKPRMGEDQPQDLPTDNGRNLSACGVEDSRRKAGRTAGGGEGMGPAIQRA